MKHDIAKRISLINESQTIAMAKAGRALKAQGHDVINLSFGEPDFQTPEHIKEAAKRAIDEGYTFYTPVAGYPELREAISQKFKRENNLNYTADQIIVSTGAKHSIMNVVLALVNPGDEVIIPSPFWVSYAEMVKHAEGIPVFIDTQVDADFKINAEQLENVINNKSKLFMFSSPCNPTGSVYTQSELEKLAEVFRKYPNLYILSDEIYEHINFGEKHYSIASIPDLYDRVITVNGVSKGFAMTGWRIGYIGAAKEIAWACEKIQGQFTSGTSSISQRAVIAALNSDMGPTYEMRNAFLRRRDIILSELSKISGLKFNKPQGAFYVFPDVSYFFGKRNGDYIINNANDLCLYLLNRVYVAVVPGEAFGNPNYMRISYAANDEIIIEAINRISKALNELK